MSLSEKEEQEKKREWWRKNRGKQYPRQKELLEKINDPSILEVLNPVEQKVLIGYFGLREEKFKSLAEIGREINLSRQRTQVIKNNALRKINLLNV